MQQDDIKKMQDTLTQHDEHIGQIRNTLYGNKDIGLVGMNEKLDSIHEILVQAKGLKGLLNVIVLCAAVIAIFKGWVLGK